MSSTESQNFPLWKKIIFLAIPIVGFLAIMEWVVRSTVPFQNVRALCFHPIMERDYCPNVKGSIKYDILLETNGDGMIDRGYPVERVPGALRVAVLGDSFTAGEEVAMGKRFHEIWEDRLQKKLAHPVEFLNFGVRGFGTWEQTQMFHLKSAKYKPDWVVVNFFWGNDVDDNINQLQAGAPNPLEDEYPVDTLWSRLLMARKNFNKWLWNHSALYQFIRTKYNLLEAKIKIWLRESKEEQHEKIKNAQKLKLQKSQPPGGTTPTDYVMKQVTNHPASGQNKKTGSPTPTSSKIKLDVDEPTNFDDHLFWDSKGWQVTRDLILKLKSEVESAGGRLAVIQFPEYNQVHDYPEVPHEEWGHFLESHGIPHFDTFPLYEQLTQEQMVATTLVREHGDHHFSENGNQVYADFTESFLENLLKP